MKSIFRLFCIIAVLSFLSSCSNEPADQGTDIACNSATGEDGEGCAAIDITKLVSREITRFNVVYTAGASGLPVGGQVSLGLHHGSEFRPQMTSPERKNFLSAHRTDTNETILLIKGSPGLMFPGQSSNKFSDRIFNQTHIATIENTALPPNEQIVFTFGAGEKQQIVQKNTDQEHEIRVTSNLDGNHTFARVLDDLKFDIVSAPATQITGTVPSQVLPGEMFDLTVVANDAFYNIDTIFSQPISVTDEKGNILIKALMFNEGLGKATISIQDEGPQRLRFATPDGSIIGRSNPFRVMKTLPELRIYWGDIHGHTGFSDGLGRNRDDYFTFGRDVADLDVLALTDHGSVDWAPLIQIVRKYHNEGEFVTLLAQEAGAGHDHMNIYLRRDNLDHISKWHKDYEEFQDWLIQQYNQGENLAQTSPHHFAYNRIISDDRYPFGHWDTRVARFVEVYSSHGTSEFPGNPRPLGRTSKDERKYMQWGLSEGLRFGVIGASDNHNSKPGHSWWGPYPNGLAGFLAPDLTREAIWEALWDYQTYGTSFDRIYMELTANGQPMGSELVGNGAVNFKGYIIGKVDDVKATLIRDGEAIFEIKTETGVIEFDFEDSAPLGNHYYYLRVEQSNGERAWSSPFWVSE